MKKIWMAFLSSVPLCNLHAQEPADALRYSWTIQGGTARQQAIGGAMGSLGGDISATFVNPAGLAFYKTGDFVLTPRVQFGKNKSTYYDRTEKQPFSKFTWGTTGFVTGVGSDYRKTKNVAVAFAYNRTADFNSDVLYRGENNQNSYSQHFLEDIHNGNIKDPNQLATNYPFGASLAFNTYWIDTVAGGSSNNFNFQSRSANLLASGSLLQEQVIQNRGGIDEFALGVGAALSEKFLLGGTLGVPVLHFQKTATFTEADATDNTANNFDYARFSEDLSTKGVGVNAKLGIIYKPVEYVRLGLAFHTPTLYNLKDNYNAAVTTNTENYKGEQSQTSADVFQQNGSGSGEFSYMLTTPYRAIFSASYVLREIEDVTKQKGFITADVEYINYKAASYQPDNQNGTDDATREYLKSLNTAIDNAYKSTFNFRLGGELKFTTLMVRAGAAYYGNPYKNINGDKGSKLNLSGGLGYRNKGMFIDLTYVHAFAKDVYYAYRLESVPYEGAHIKSGVGNVIATLGFKF